MMTTEIYLHKGKPIRRTSLSDWEGDIRTLIPELESPRLSWNGEKLSYDLLRECLAFFRYIEAVHHSEAQLRFVYNPEPSTEIGERHWEAICLPQYVGTGLFTAEIDTSVPSAKQEHIDQRAQAFARFPNHTLNGTNHSHCKISAFQSGTDHNDEKEQHGLHVTLGHVDRDEIEIHGRVTFRGIEYPVVWNEWLDIRSDPETPYPGPALLKWKVELPHDPEELKSHFPAEWLTVCHKKPVPVYTPTRYNHRTIYPNDSYEFQNDWWDEQRGTRTFKSPWIDDEDETETKTVEDADTSAIDDLLARAKIDKDLDVIVLREELEYAMTDAYEALLTVIGTVQTLDELIGAADPYLGAELSTLIGFEIKEFIYKELEL